MRTSFHRLADASTPAAAAHTATTRHFSCGSSSGTPATSPIGHAIVAPMATTSMQLDSGLRDELVKIAEQDFHGAPLGEAVKRLVKEHKINRIMQRYEELRANPEEWASYQAESRVIDNAAGDGLPDAGEEYSEYHQ